VNENRLIWGGRLLSIEDTPKIFVSLPPSVRLKIFQSGWCSFRSSYRTCLWLNVSGDLISFALPEALAGHVWSYVLILTFRLEWLLHHRSIWRPISSATYLPPHSTPASYSCISPSRFTSCISFTTDLRLTLKPAKNATILNKIAPLHDCCICWPLCSIYQRDSVSATVFQACCIFQSILLDVISVQRLLIGLTLHNLTAKEHLWRFLQ
jgi:hypothetical protein